MASNTTVTVKANTKANTKATTKTAQAKTAQAKAIPYFVALLDAIQKNPAASVVRAFLARADAHHSAKGTKFPRVTTEAARAAMTASTAQKIIARIAQGEGKAVAGSRDGQAVYDMLRMGADLTPEQRAK